MKGKQLDELPLSIPAPLERFGTLGNPNLSKIPTTFARTLRDPLASESQCYECCVSCLGSCCGFIGAYVPCCLCHSPYIDVPQGHAGVISRFGRAYRVVDPGHWFVNPFAEEMHLINIKLHITDVPRHMVVTKDNVSIDIDSVIYWHVVDPFVAEFQIADIREALMQRTMTTLRDSLGSYTLQTIIENREKVSIEIWKIIHKAAKLWGTVVESILLKNINFSESIEHAILAAAKQQRIGEGRVIEAKAEVEAAKLLREASEILNTPAAMKIRHLDTMNTMAREGDTKLIFMHESFEEMNKFNQ